MHILLPILAAAVTLTWLWAMPAAAQAPAADHHVVVIVDASGSMGQDLKGNRTNLETPPKIVEARKYVSSFFEGLPKEALDAKIGLMAYGLGKRGDCQSVDVLIELDPGSGQPTWRPTSVDVRGRAQATPGWLSSARRQAPVES